jgi:ribosomal protein L11 methyltransferase
VKLGAAHVDAIDIDPIAVAVAAENCAVNGVNDRVTLSVGTLAAGGSAGYDLIVANISTEANIGLAPAFASHARSGAHLVLSGILSQDAERVTSTMQAVGFAHHEMREERDWALFHMRKA